MEVLHCWTDTPDALVYFTGIAILIAVDWFARRLIIPGDFLRRTKTGKCKVGNDRCENGSA
jgi:hypothetical protein